MARAALLAAVALLALAAPAAAQDRFERFNAAMTGGEETPPVLTSASAPFQLIIDNRRQTGRWSMSVRNTTGFTMSHIHLGAPGVAGPAVVALYPPFPRRTPHTVAGDQGLPKLTPPLNVVDQAFTGRFTAKDLINDQGKAPPAWDQFVGDVRAGGAYVNLHTTAHPLGEVRGQLKRMT